ncbi:DUF4148 domain-containing protein [Trinickia sp. YCB016]
MNKRTMIFTLILAAGTSIALNAQAQEKTRAQVRADLIRLEQAGYNPASENEQNYPVDIQTAQAKVTAQDAEQQAVMPQQQEGDSGMGAETKGTSDSSHKKQETHPSNPSTCVGPISFCTLYFGGS